MRCSSSWYEPMNVRSVLTDGPERVELVHGEAGRLVRAVEVRQLAQLLEPDGIHRVVDPRADLDR